MGTQQSLMKEEDLLLQRISNLKDEMDTTQRQLLGLNKWECFSGRNLDESDGDELDHKDKTNLKLNEYIKYCREEIANEESKLEKLRSNYKGPCQVCSGIGNILSTQKDDKIYSVCVKCLVETAQKVRS